MVDDFRRERVGMVKNAAQPERVWHEKSGTPKRAAENQNKLDTS
jgi:hypothetical protein